MKITSNNHFSDSLGEKIAHNFFFQIFLLLLFYDLKTILHIYILIILQKTKYFFAKTIFIVIMIIISCLPALIEGFPARFFLYSSHFLLFYIYAFYYYRGKMIITASMLLFLQTDFILHVYIYYHYYYFLTEEVMMQNVCILLLFIIQSCIIFPVFCLFIYIFFS